MWVFVIIIFICVVAATLSNAKQREGEINEARVKQTEALQERGTTISASYEWSDGLSRNHYRFIADDNAQKILIYAGVGASSHVTIPYSKVLGYEVKIDSQIVGGVGRAVAGGILAGGAGAIVGAQTAKKKEVSSFQAIIYKDDVASPTYVFDFTKNGKITTKLPEYTDALKFSENINGVIKSIIHRSSNNTKQNDLSVNESNNISEKLEQLKKAYEMDLITEAEYSKKKQELLNRF